MARTIPARRLALAGLLGAALGVAAPPCRADGGLRKGPWLMEPRPESIVVMVERLAPGPIHVRAVALAPADAGAPAPIEADDPRAVTLHEVVLGHLTPGARYRYEVTGPGVTPTGGTFGAPPRGDAPFRFVIYGDTRTGAAAHAVAVARIQTEGADFVLHTGDLVEDGRREAQWQRFFAIERDLLRDVPLVPVIGNHEITGHGAGVDNFRRYVHYDAASPAPELDYPFAYGNVRLVVLDAYHDWAAPPMRAWLAAELARARREVPTGFVLVAMHWGLCSCGPHGENRVMRRAGIDDLFRRAGVDLVISGHDHLYERGDDHGLRYIVSGGGGAELYHQTHVRGYTLAYAPEHHYVRADVERDGIRFTAVRFDGTVIDACTLRTSGWDCPRPASPPATPASGVRTAGVDGPMPAQVLPWQRGSRARRSCACASPGRRTGGLDAPGALGLALGVAPWLRRRGSRATRVRPRSAARPSARL